MLQTAIQTQERVIFYRAREDHERDPGNSNSIATMMELALEAACDHIRHLAGRWLLRRYGVVVVHEESPRDATPAQATGIRR